MRFDIQRLQQVWRIAGALIGCARLERSAACACSGVWSLEGIYRDYGRDILAKASTSPPLSDAITEAMTDVRRAMQIESAAITSSAKLRSFLAGYGAGVVASAVAHPDQQTDAFTMLGYSGAAVRLGALCQIAFAEGVLKMSPPPVLDRR